MSKVMDEYQAEKFGIMKKWLTWRHVGYTVASQVEVRQIPDGEEFQVKDRQTVGLWHNYTLWSE